MEKFIRINKSLISLNNVRRIDLYNNGTTKNPEWQIKIAYCDLSLEFIAFGKGEQSLIDAENAMKTIHSFLNGKDA